MTAIERARIAYELMMRRQQAAVAQRRQHDRSRLIRIVAVLSCSLVLVVGAALYNGWIPLRSYHGWDGGAFGISRTGHVRSFVAGNTCKELEFNNVRGTYTGGSFGPCDIILIDSEARSLQKGSRMDSIRDAFAR